MKAKTIGVIGGVSVALVTGLALMMRPENIGPTKSACEIYRGWTMSPDGENIFVFDPKKRDERGLDIEYPLVGEDSLRNSMVIGRTYCFDYTDSVVPGVSKKLVGTPRLADESRESERD